jgi:hypothetical protein
MSKTHHHRRKIGGKKHYSRRRFKPLNCHPSLKKHNKKVLDHSCLTADALHMLKDSFNKHYPDKKIETSDPKQIWHNLHNKIPECDKETCWLSSIPDTHLQNKLKTELFTPFQPSEWKHNKNAWLSNHDIDKVLKQYKSPEFIHLGPTPIDFDKKKTDGQCVWNELCKLSLATEYKKGVRKIGIIYNLDTHRGPGTHWVSMFINFAEENGEKPFIFYFNSTSQRMPSPIHDLIERLQTQWMEFKGTKFHVYKNTRVKHQRSNSECGMYSLFFIITCLTRKTDLMPDKVLSINDLVELFAGKHRIDDHYVAKFREIYFNPAS